MALGGPGEVLEGSWIRCLRFPCASHLMGPSWARRWWGLGGGLGGLAVLLKGHAWEILSECCGSHPPPQAAPERPLEGSPDTLPRESLELLMVCTPPNVNVYVCA